MQRWKGSIHSSTAATSSTTTAVGIWNLTEQLQAKQAGAWPASGSFLLDYLVVAGGGGGGGGQGGGGGAGGLLAATSLSVSPFTAYTITVGAGGSGGNWTPTTVKGTSGNNSVFSTFTSIGGGGGGAYGGTTSSLAIGLNGGSGGGGGDSGSTPNPGTGTVGPPRQGYDGGTGATGSFDAGGGGGAGAVGGNGGSGTGGSGGVGVTSTLPPPLSCTANIASNTTLTVTAISTGKILGGTVLVHGSIPGGTYIVNQQWGATGTAVVSTTATGSNAAQTITVGSATNIALNQLVAGNGAAASGIPTGTYVTNISGSTITLSNALTSSISGATLYFYTPNGIGVYTLSAAATATTTGITVTSNGMYFAGGGGGTGNVTVGSGGAGGGGAGGRNSPFSGYVNTGGGGGGGRDAWGGYGGSGVVILKIPNTYTASFTSGVVSTVDTSVSGYKIYTVTATSTTSETVTFT